MKQREVSRRDWRNGLSLAGLVGLMVAGGLAHFAATDKYVAAVPRFLPWRQGIVYVSGVFEIACGIVLIPRRTRSAGGWLTALVLILIFPANIQMAIDGPKPGSGFPFDSSVALWLRLPLQTVFIAWAYSFAKAGGPKSESNRT